MNNLIKLLRKSISELRWYPGLLLLGWVVVCLSLPWLYRFLGEQAVLQGLALVILLQLAFVLNVLYRAWGWWSTLRIAVEVLLMAWIVQAIVVRSGLPYGDLHYTPFLQPQLLQIPIQIPLMWLMMLPPAWAIARLITHKMSGCLMRFLFILFSAIAFTAWGFYIDPLMVHLGLLYWTPNGALSGTPWLNYTGWLLVSGVITFGVSPKRIPAGLLFLIYILTWLIQFIALLFFGGLTLAALIGFLLMGLMVLFAAIPTTL
jgi:uncharacterized membrane protein